MKFRVGDKVKFLNESGGGVISRIISPGMVSVAIEDGFEIPVMISEIIKMEVSAPLDSPRHMFREDFSTEVAPQSDSQPETQYEEGNNIPLKNNPARGVLAEGIYFGFIPHDQKWLITGLMDIYLINHTSYDLLYSLFLEEGTGKFMGTDYGSVVASSMQLIETCERDHLGKWDKGIVQVLFHRDKDHKVLNPGNSKFRIRPERFYQETNYKDSAIMEGKSILVSLLPLSAQTSLVHNEIKNKEKDQEVVVVESREVEPEHIIDKHRTGPHEAVVDLHIGELVQDYRMLQNAEILKVQVNYFTRCLDSAIVNKLKKVTFIHGVGSGVLKTTLKMILKDYPNTEYRDASMQHFGYGALDVIIH